MNQLQDDRIFLHEEIGRCRREISDIMMRFRTAVGLFLFLSFGLSAFLGSDVFSGRFIVFGMRVSGSAVLTVLVIGYVATFVVGLVASDDDWEKRSRWQSAYMLCFTLSLVLTAIAVHVLEKSLRIG